jgi:hypothetical protein
LSTNSRAKTRKAWEHRSITSRVNPRNTSRECADCYQPVARYNAGEAPIEYRPCALLFLCPDCLKRVILPPKDRPILVEMMLKELGMASPQDHLAKFL